MAQLRNLHSTVSRPGLHQGPRDGAGLDVTCLGPQKDRRRAWLPAWNSALQRGSLDFSLLSTASLLYTLDSTPGCFSSPLMLTLGNHTAATHCLPGIRGSRVSETCKGHQTFVRAGAARSQISVRTNVCKILFSWDKSPLQPRPGALAISLSAEPAARVTQLCSKFFKSDRALAQ